MKKIFLLCCMIMITALGLKAQSTLTVADGTATDSYIPVYGFYMDASQKSQSIYPESMLTGLQGAQITGLTYYFSSAPSGSWGGTQTVKIGITTNTNLSGFISETTTLVWTGTLSNCINGNTMHIVLDQGFTYTGGNLLIEVEHPNSSSYSSATFYGASQSGTTSYMEYYSPHSASFLPKLTFDYQTGTCFSPGGLTASGTNDNSTVLSWAPSTVGTPDYYTLAYRPASDTDFTEILNVTDTFYQLSGLTSSTTYFWKVKTTCTGSDESGWSALNSFMTSQVAAQLPYTQDFEDATENANWTLLNGGTNNWVIGTAVNNTTDGSTSLYVSNDNGASNSYDNSTASTTWAYRDIDFGTASEYALSFSWRAQGESSSYDYLKVFIGTPTTPPSGWSYSGSFAGATLLGTYNQSSSWNTVNISLPSSYSGVQRLYFMWWNDGSGGSNPPAAVDNITVTGSNCGSPFALALDSTTSSSIAFHFTPASTDDNAWQTVVVPSGSQIDETLAEDIYSTDYEFTGLADNTLYNVYVRTNCGSEYSNWSLALTVRTDCDEYTLPYTENFDSFTAGSGNQPTCWYFTNSSYPYVSSSYSTSASNSLYFYYLGSAYCAAMPAVPYTDSLGNNINLSDLRLRFNARHTSSSYSITVGVMTDPSDMSTYTALQTINPGDNTSSFEPQEVFFTNYTGTGRYIAFQGNSSYMYIDDIVLDYAPACGEVTNLEVSSIAGTSAMLTWEDGAVGTTVDYTVEYSEYGQDNWIVAGTGVTNTYYLLSGLTQQTHYEVRVAANCEDGSSSVYTTEDFTTSCMAGGDIQFGEGGSNSSYLPAYSCYNYAMSEQLFTAAELGGANTFNSISFQVSSVATASRYWDIYLMPTTQTSLSGVVAVDTTVGAKVFSGTISNFAPGWVTINFNTPFQYDGQSNLILIVDDNTGSYNCSNYFYYHSNPNGSSYYCYSDSYNADPFNPSSYSGSFYTNSNRANVIFGGNCDSTATCIIPNMFVNNVTYNSADVIWAAGYQETAWEMEYKEHSESTWTSVPNPAGFFTTVTGLSAQTAYDLRMRADCGGEYSDWTMRTFTTDCGPIETLPYTQGFENSTSIDGSEYLTCWYRYTNDPSHYAYVHTSDGATGTHSLDFHHTPAPTKVIAILPQMGSSINVADLMASFYLKMTENMSAAIMEVGVMDDPADATTFETVDTVHMTNQAWTYVNVPLTNYTGSGKYIAFRVSNGTGHGFRLDDLTIDYTPTCLGPQYVTATNITQTDADISWTEMGDATSWNIEYGVHGFTPGQGDGVVLSNVSNPVTITGLTNATTYDVYVTSNCGGGAVSNMSPIYSFGTLLCDSADKCNYTFALTDGYGDGWNGNAIGVYTNGILVTTLTLSSGSNGSFTVPLCDQTTTTLKFTSGSYADEISFTLTNPFGEEIFACNEGDAYNYSNNQVIFTDLTNCTVPTCARPSNLAVVSTTTTTVELGWNEMGTATTWNIEYGPAGFTQGTGTLEVATTNPYLVSNLEDTVQYDFYVQADCGGGDVSQWRGPLTTYPGIYIMASTGTDTVSMCGGIIYDNGGASGSYSSSSNSTLIIMPDQPGMLVALQGSYNTESCCDDLTIYDGIGTNGTQLGEFAGSGNINVVSTTGPLTLYFHSDGSVQYDGFALQVSCTPAPTCMKPVGLAATGATTTSVNVAWTEMGTATTWNIEYGAPGFTPGTGTTVVATSNPYTLTGLTASTSYAVRVQADCGGGDLSEWSDAITFATECDVVTTFPYTQGFENGGQAPACWNNSYVSGSANWVFQTGNYSTSSSVTTAHTGTYNAMFFSSSNATTKLVSPMFDLTQVSNPYISYWYSQEAWGGDQDQLTVYYRTSPSDAWVQLAAYTSDIDVWTFDSLALPSPSATYQIAFEGYGDYGYGITLDDITIDGQGGSTPTTCDAPTALAASNIAQTSATINWTAGGTETAWNLQYKAASATDWSASIAVNNNPTYNLTGLTANTAYQVRVQAACSATETSTWTTANFTTAAEEQCPAPTNFHAENITLNSVTLAWEQAAGTANEWEINYKAASATTWTNVTVTTNPYTITDLTPETAYQAQIIAHCVNGVNSDATEVITFTTLPDGIEDYVLDNSTVLYPNPTSGIITVHSSQFTVNTVNVYDVYGKLLMSVEVSGNVATIDATSFAAGVYFAKVETEKGVVTKRFVKK